MFLPDSNKEYVLYHFKFEIDSTIYITYPYYDSQNQEYPDTTYLKIYDVDTVFLFGAYRRRMLLNRLGGGEFPVYPDKDYNLYWIEGIGSSVGLFYLPYEKKIKKSPQTCAECDWLKGFYTSYPMPVGCGDVTCFFVGTEEELTPFQPKIYPNPSAKNQSFYIEFEQATNFEASVFDLQGKLIFSSHFSQVQRTSIPTKLKPGIYFVRIKAHSRGFTQRLVVH